MRRDIVGRCEEERFKRKYRKGREVVWFEWIGLRGSNTLDPSRFLLVKRELERARLPSPVPVPSSPTGNDWDWVWGSNTESRLNFQEIFGDTVEARLGSSKIRYGRKIAVNIVLSGTIEWQGGESQKWINGRLRTRISSWRAVDRKLNKYLLLAECEVRTASYGPSFFLLFMAQARSARAMKTRKEKNEDP